MFGIENDNYLGKWGHSGAYGGVLNEKVYTVRLPRHSSFTINHTFVNLGILRHNMTESIVNTTVSTTKAHRG